MKHSHAFRTLWRSSTIITTMLLAAGSALAQSDNFDDGNDDGWTRYDPLGVLGAGPRAAFSFPSGAYQVSALTSPSVAQAGPARAGAFRTDVNYTDFYISVDIVSWDFSIDMALGLFARTREIGLGATDGYVFNYNPRQSFVEGSYVGQLQINRVNNEDPEETLATLDITLDPTQNDYRFVFIGVGSSLTGRVYTLDNANTPVAQITTTDGTWTEGYPGFFVYDRSEEPSGTAVGTFDNFVAAATEPPPPQPDPVTISGLQVVAGELRFGFQGQAGFSYQVQQATVLPAQPEDWTEVQTFPAESSAGARFSAVPMTGEAGYVRVVSPAPPAATAP